jgi:hypothetical protein
MNVTSAGDGPSDERGVSADGLVGVGIPLQGHPDGLHHRVDRSFARRGREMYLDPCVSVPSYQTFRSYRVGVGLLQIKTSLYHVLVAYHRPCTVDDDDCGPFAIRECSELVEGMSSCSGQHRTLQCQSRTTLDSWLCSGPPQVCDGRQSAVPGAFQLDSDDRSRNMT